MTDRAITKTTDAAIAEVREAFPFEGYFGANLAPWQTVGDTIRTYLQPGDTLFDLGSGPCDKTSVAQVMGVQCTAVDDLGDDWHKQGDNIAIIKDFAARMGVRFSQDFTPPEPGSFDMVMMNDVLEHIHDSPRDLLNALVTGLKPGGLLFVTVPNLANARKRLSILRGRTNLPNYDLYYWYRGPWRGPKREYVRGDLEAMCRHLSLEILELRAVHHMLQNLPAKARPIYKALTAALPDWRDTWLLVARKPQDWSPKTEISDAEFARIYGRSANANLYAVKNGKG